MYKQISILHTKIISNNDNLNFVKQIQSLCGLEQTVAKNKNIKYLGYIDNIDNNTYIVQDQTQQQKTTDNSYIQSYQFQNQQNQIFTLFKNVNTKIQQTFEPNLNVLAIKKHSLSRDDNFDKECKILKLLNGHKITLDLIQQDLNTYQFDQIAGKTNLYTLHQKTENRHLFEVQFLILLDKLNKMHQLGVAHSDIKPQNIVISYDDEPFFIDFDASVLLQEYRSYLNSFTSNYNLNVNVQKIKTKNGPKYNVKKFLNEEEIKLCDRTQLAITFLYLLCSDQKQIDLFYIKDFNQLIIQLQDDESKNREIILSLISRILNEADQNIKIIGDEQLNTFFIDHSIINEELQYSNDIFFIQEENIYKVNRIDKFNKMNCNIDINPSDIIIIPLPDLDEYQYIYEKYEQIKEYHQQLIDYCSFSNKSKLNFYEYMKVLKNEKCKIYLSKFDQDEIIFRSIQDSNYIETLKIKFKFDNTFFEEFIQIMKSKLTGFNILNFKQVEGIIVCKICKIIDDNPYIKNVKFIFFETHSIEQKLQDFFNFTQDYFKIGQIQIIIKNSFKQQQSIQEYQLCVEKLAELLQNKYSYSICIQTKQKIKINENHLFDLNEFEEYKNMFDNTNIQKDKFIIQEDYLDKLTQKFKLQSNKQYNTGNSIVYDVKSISFKEGQNITFQILQNTKIIKQLSLIIIFKYYNCLFTCIRLWQELKKYVQNQENITIEIILVNCQFSQDVANLLKDLDCSLVKYEFQNEIQQFEDDEQIKGYLIQLRTQKWIWIEIFIIWKNYYYIGINQLQRLVKKQKYKHIYQDWKKLTDMKPRNIDFKYMHSQQQVKRYKKQTLQQLRIPYQVNDIILKIKSKNKLAIGISKEDINFIKEEILDKNYYQEIQISINNNKFIYLEKEQIQQKQLIPHINIQYYYESNENDLYEQFQQLFSNIINSYNHFKIQNFKLDIQQIKNYQQQITIQQSIQTFQQLMSQNDIPWKYFQQKIQEDSEQLFILKLQFKLMIREYPQEIQPFQNKKEDTLANLLIDNLNDFQNQYCFTNQQTFKDLFKDNDYIVEFFFKGQNIEDMSFKIIFQGIENIIKLKQRWYTFQECEIKKQTLYNINEIIKFYEEQQMMFKDQKMIQTLQNEYQDYMKYNKSEDILILQNKPQQSKIQAQNLFVIRINFNKKQQFFPNIFENISNKNLINQTQTIKKVNLNDIINNPKQNEIQTLQINKEKKNQNESNESYDSDQLMQFKEPLFNQFQIPDIDQMYNQKVFPKITLEDKQQGEQNISEAASKYSLINYQLLNDFDNPIFNDILIKHKEHIPNNKQQSLYEPNQSIDIYENLQVQQQFTDFMQNPINQQILIRQQNPQRIIEEQKQNESNLSQDSNEESQNKDSNQSESQKSETLLDFLKVDNQSIQSFNKNRDNQDPAIKFQQQQIENFIYNEIHQNKIDKKITKLIDNIKKCLLNQIADKNLVNYLELKQQIQSQN